MNIVGVGNVLMGDDGVGVAAVEELTRRTLPGCVRLHDAGLAVADVLGRLEPREPLVVIDALRAGGAAGSVYKGRLDEMSLREGHLAGCISLHELSVIPALGLEALGGRAFEDVTIFGVEPDVVAWGRGLSPTVAAALDRLIDTVLEHIDRYNHAAAGEPSQ